MLQVQHKFSQIKSGSEEMENSLKFPPPPFILNFNVYGKTENDSLQ